MLHSRGLGANQLNACLNHALIVSLISYALPAWEGLSLLASVAESTLFSSVLINVVSASI